MISALAVIIQKMSCSHANIKLTYTREDMRFGRLRPPLWWKTFIFLGKGADGINLILAIEIV